MGRLTKRLTRGPTQRLPAGVRSRLTLPRLLTAALLIAGVLALAATLRGGGADHAPADHAARLAPADAVLYLHLKADRGSRQWKRGADLLGRVPALERIRDRFLRALTRRGGALDLEREVYPWLGDEAALALMPDRGRTARSLFLLEVSDSALARSFLSRSVGREVISSYRGTTVSTYGRLATAFVGGFLAIGQPAHVRSVIDASAGRTPSLAGQEAFRRARARLPDRDRLLLAYASSAGLRRVLEPRPALEGRAARLFDDPALDGVAASVRAERHGARIDVSSALSQAGLGAAAAETFQPRLPGSIAGDALAYVGMRGADRILDAIRSFAGPAIELPRPLRELGQGLVSAGGLATLRRLRPLLQEEAALFVSRSAAVPVITVVVDDVDRQESDQVLALLPPLLERLSGGASGAGQVATLRPLRVAGVNAVSLRLSPALELTYAVFGGRAVLATSPGGIARVKQSRSKLTDNSLFAPGLRGRLGRVTSVVFLDLEQLLALGEQAGLGGAPGFEQLRSDLSPVRALSAVTHGGPASKTAEIFIEVP